ncbi:MAG: MFS transporter [Legionella sp.]|nr:MFS transporter [Legionella sp.]
MKSYNKILFSMSAFSSVRMITGAISVIYMFTSGLGLDSIAYVKTLQAIVTLCFSLSVAKFMDKFNRKTIYITAMISSAIWLFILFLGGYFTQTLYFYIAEVFNAIALVIYNSIYNAYLLDEYYKVEKNKNFEHILGQYNNLSFLGMAIFAGAGSFAYEYLNEYLFLISSILMLIFIFHGLILLPVQYSHFSKTDRLKKKLYRKGYETKLIIRKFLQLSPFIISLILVSIYYQLLIQYWQVLASTIPLVNNKPYILGAIFIISLFLQSLAGRLMKYLDIRALPYSFIFIIVGLVFLYCSLQFLNIYYMVIGLSLLFFNIRLNIILTNAKSHKNLTTQVRARFDSYLYTTTIVLTGLFLLLSGYLIQWHGISFLIYLGLMMIIFSFASLLLIPQNYFKRNIGSY